jgi:hypothetical protein
VNDLRKFENLHVALWLVKDCAWCAGWRWVGMSMVIPALALAAKIAWESRKDVTDLVHNVVVCVWMCANITWMIGEFFYDDGPRPIASAFFYAGLVLIGAFYAKEGAQRVFSRQ